MTTHWNPDARACPRCALPTDLGGLSLHQAGKQGRLRHPLEHDEIDCLKRLRDAIAELQGGYLVRGTVSGHVADLRPNLQWIPRDEDS